MAKYEPSTITSGYHSTQSVNEELVKIAEAFENTLSRDGTTPNQMQSDLDMNGFRVLNVPAPVNDSDLVRLSDLDPEASSIIQQASDARDAAEGFAEDAEQSASYAESSNIMAGIKANRAESAADRAEMAALTAPLIYSGFVVEGGTDNSVPSGWTVSGDGTVGYTVTHNLGLSTPTTESCLVFVTLDDRTGDGVDARVRVYSDYFYVALRDSVGDLAPGGFFFQMLVL